MSDGFVAKMSELSRKKSTSALSYFGSRSDPMTAVLVGSPVCKSTVLILISLGGLILTVF